MMYKKETKSKSHWFIGVISILMLLAVVCVGSAAAATSIDVNDGNSLLDALNKLDSDDVIITLTGDVDNFNANEVAGKLITTFINPASKSRTLTVELNGYQISLSRGNGVYSATLKGSGTATLSVVNHVTTLTLPSGVKLSGKFTCSPDTIEFNDFTDATITLKRGNDDGDCSISVSGTTDGKLTVNNVAFAIKNLHIVNQQMKIEAGVKPQLKVIVSSSQSTPVTGTVKISGAEVTVSSSNFRFGATYASSIAIDADITGTATLMADQSMSEVISVPSFVTGTLELNGHKLGISTEGRILNSDSNPIRLNGPGSFTNALTDDKVTIDLTRFYWSDDRKTLYAGSKPSLKPTVNVKEGGVVEIKSNGNTKVKKEGTNKVVISSSDTSEKVEITITAASVADSADGIDITGVSSIAAKYPELKAGENTGSGVVTQDKITITSLIVSGETDVTKAVELPTIDTEYNKDVANKVPSGVTPKTMISGKGGSANYQNVEIELRLSPAGQNKEYVVYHVKETGSPEKVSDVSYTSGNLKIKSKKGFSSYVVGIKAISSGGGGSGGGGSSGFIPTYTPDVTPTPTYEPTGVPTIYPTGVPTQQPQSPMPIFGILAGLGAAALAGVVLRRK